jgi:hypothetical protein
MPSVDLIEEMQTARDAILKAVDGQLAAPLIERAFATLIELADDERREWDRVLSFLMEKEWDE